MLARNSMDSIVLAFACQRAGAVYVPLNWRLNAAELRPILPIARRPCWFTTRSSRQPLPAW